MKQFTRIKPRLMPSRSASGWVNVYPWKSRLTHGLPVRSLSVFCPMPCAISGVHDHDPRPLVWSPMSIWKSTMTARSFTRQNDDHLRAIDGRCVCPDRRWSRAGAANFEAFDDVSRRQFVPVQPAWQGDNRYYLIFSTIKVYISMA